MSIQTTKELIAQCNQLIEETHGIAKRVKNLQDLIIYRRTGIPPIARQIHAFHERRRLTNPHIRRSQ